MKKKKPVITVDMDGPEGNIFFIIVKAMKAMIANGATRETRDEFWRNLKECHSYRESVDMINEYVTIKKTKGGVPM